MKKLTVEQVAEIRRLWRPAVTMRELARRFGVSHTTVRRVIAQDMGGSKIEEGKSEAEVPRG